MHSVLRDLGNYPEDNIELLRDPAGWEVMESLREFERILMGHAGKEEQTIFLFYYSGHARSNGINLGMEEISLDTLRKQLTGLPSTVTVIILDACQSGAISNVKGIEPAADFSYNSAVQLNTEGTVLIASSTSSELSQESLELNGSFFTHHFTVGLRGAADVDSNGMVTLLEAYEYAYHAVLRSTAATAIGKQHVTLETDLRGKGEMVLTWPRIAGAKLMLETEMEGEILLTHLPSKKVLAEIYKIRGDELLLAIPEGEYEALVKKRNSRVEKCDLKLVDKRVASIEAGVCQPVLKKNAKPKGAELEVGVTPAPRLNRRETLFFEFFLGLLNGHQSDYSKRLEVFRYEDANEWASLSLKAGIGFSPMKYLAFVLSYTMLDSRSCSRELYAGDNNSVSWRSHGAGVDVRGNLPLKGGLIVPYLQAGGGYTWTQFDFNHRGGSEHEFIHSYQLGGALGLQLNPWPYFGFTLIHVEYLFVPTIENELGDRHLSGGLGVFAGLRGGY